MKYYVVGIDDDSGLDDGCLFLINKNSGIGLKVG